MGRSLTLRVYRLQLVAHFGLAFATAPCHRHLTLLQTSNSPDHYAKGTPSAACGASSALSLRPLVGTRFQVLFVTPHLGFFSPFPHGTCSLSVTREYLALRDGPRRFPPDFTCPVVLGRLIKEPTRFRLQDYHLLWSEIPIGSTSVLVFYSSALRPTRSHDPSARKRARV